MEASGQGDTKKGQIIHNNLLELLPLIPHNMTLTLRPLIGQKAKNGIPFWPLTFPKRKWWRQLSTSCSTLHLCNCALPLRTCCFRFNVLWIPLPIALHLMLLCSSVWTGYLYTLPALQCICTATSSFQPCLSGWTVHTQNLLLYIWCPHQIFMQASKYFLNVCLSVES